MTRKFDRGKSWPPNTPGAREAEDDIKQQTPTPENNTQGFEEHMDSGNEATEVSTKINKLHQPQNTNSLRDTRENTAAHMIFEGEPAIKLHAKNIEVRTGV